MKARLRWSGLTAWLSWACLAGAQAQPVELQIPVTTQFRFVAYGDTRFTDPNETEASNPPVRRALVQERAIPVLPALGNHDLKGNEKTALANYFARFPDIKNNRYYSARAANTMMLVLDSALDETSGAQGSWLNTKLDSLPADVDFVLIVLHHPPYTSSSDEKKFGGGHSARSPEQTLARMLEERQSRTRARFVVFSGHVHNYERHEHGGIPYFVTGGGGAHAYPIERAAKDLFQNKEINYHYLLCQVDGRTLKITMNRLEMKDGKATWTQPDSLTIAAPAATAAKAAGPE